MSEEQKSITMMLADMKGGDEFAAQLLWDRFFDRVRGLAKKKLGGISKKSMDEEDIALSAINALYTGAKAGRFAKLEDRDDLWQILCMITSRKAASAWRKQSARKEVGESIVGLTSTEMAKNAEKVRWRSFEIKTIEVSTWKPKNKERLFDVDKIPQSKGAHHDFRDFYPRKK